MTDARAESLFDALRQGEILEDEDLVAAAEAFGIKTAAGISEADARVTVSLKTVEVLLAQNYVFALNELNLRQRLLSDRIAALEAGGIRYEGVHQRAIGYRRGSVVTQDSAMWVALRDTQPGEIPGEAKAAWQLAARPKVPKEARAFMAAAKSTRGAHDER
ncbi:transposase [Propylenella binzhouense]|uniref:Transposase n=1 Tax=Propylenella binzhouense TaxID=2555902 RepID=A0A964T3M4_9HYPH|nr:transposase [Propylenella binzhouense]MYZ47327.1 transposase [Propylenella binzhouense]